MSTQQRTTLQKKIDEAKAQLVQALRPFNNKFRSMIVGAALSELDIQVPDRYSASYALNSNEVEEA